ncbi:MAG TPA: N-acetylglucosamine-6-phosphate deacetylase [Pyrinomonadaceae bacterium]|nr:N-acetylglucosamine-6-phosphate deacetylase [Pyrinomonadaceae bacterium]
MLLRNARVVLPQKIAERAILIEGERIARILELHASESVNSDVVIDLNGLTLFPGFIDIHIHGSVGVDTNEADAPSLNKVARFLAENGVTSWMPTLVPDSEENYSRAIEAIDELIGTQTELEPAAARAVGVHYEGPFVNEKQCGALRTQFFKTFAAGNDLKSLPRLSAHDAVHLITLAPEIEGGIELVKELVKQNWMVSIGHTRATVDVLDRALEAGARHMTHFMNAMSPLHHRAPGPIGWGLTNDSVSVDIIADGVHVDPLVLKLVLRCKQAESVSLISDAVAPTGLGDGEYKIWGETINVTNGRTENARGSIAGSVITMLDAVRMMLSLGVAATDVARMASTNPARLLGIDKDCGSIETDRRADLVALDDEGHVRLTLVGGNIVFRE